MTGEQLRAVAYQKPFRPFRVLLASGERFEIKRTMRTAIADDRVAFGIDEDDVTRVARRLRLVPLRDIESVELL